jgi:hypothetical protein
MDDITLTLSVAEANMVLAALEKHQIQLAELHTKVKVNAERQLAPSLAVQSAEPEGKVRLDL